MDEAAQSFEKLQRHLIAFTTGGEKAKASIADMMEAFKAGDIETVK
jgi:hypothetical protein